MTLRGLCTPSKVTRTCTISQALAVICRNSDAFSTPAPLTDAPLGQRCVKILLNSSGACSQTSMSSRALDLLSLGVQARPSYGCWHITFRTIFFGLSSQQDMCACRDAPHAGRGLGLGTPQLVGNPAFGSGPELPSPACSEPSPDPIGVPAVRAWWQQHEAKENQSPKVALPDENASQGTFTGSVSDFAQCLLHGRAKCGTCSGRMIHASCIHQPQSQPQVASTCPAGP